MFLLLCCQQFQAAETHLQLFPIVRKAGAFLSKDVSRFPIKLPLVPTCFVCAEVGVMGFAILIDDERQT